MLTTLVDEPFSDADWIFEAKLDGEHCLTFRQGKQLRLISRNRKPLNDVYPELVAPLADQPAQEFIADGEIVAFEGRVTSFSKLHQRMQLRSADEARRRA